MFMGANNSTGAVFHATPAPGWRRPDAPYPNKFLAMPVPFYQSIKLCDVMCSLALKYGERMQTQHHASV